MLISRSFLGHAAFALYDNSNINAVKNYIDDAVSVN